MLPSSVNWERLGDRRLVGGHHPHPSAQHTQLVDGIEPIPGSRES